MLWHIHWLQCCIQEKHEQKQRGLQAEIQIVGFAVLGVFLQSVIPNLRQCLLKKKSIEVLEVLEENQVC